VPAPGFAPEPAVDDPDVDEGLEEELDDEELDEEPALEPAAVEVAPVACFVLGWGSGVNGLRVAPPVWSLAPGVSATACAASVLTGLSAIAPAAWPTAGEPAGGVDELDPPNAA
jgi:hypothetical protein